MSLIKFPALTIHNPFAALFSYKLKPIENRTFRPPPNLIGCYWAIHAGLTWSPIWETCSATKIIVEKDIEKWKAEPRGVIVCFSRLLGYYDPMLKDQGKELYRKEDEKWWFKDQGFFGWVFRDTIRIDEPIAARGQLRTWYIDIDSAIVSRIISELSI